MGYSGYYQLLCEKGHLNHIDAYEYFQDEKICRNHDCEAKIVWWNSVDQTNGSYCDCPAGDWAMGLIEGDPNLCCEHCDNGRIDRYVELEVDQKAQFEECQCCGHKKLISERTYKIPERGGHRVE
jgi:hypothetical protein